MVLSVSSILDALIPMFVAMDPIGGLPYFLTLTATSSLRERLGVLRTAILTANLALLLFLVGGKLILKAMGITLHDFEVAGGIVILALAINDILSSPPSRGGAATSPPNRNVGVVPLGIPLLAGPATFTTELLLVQHLGPWLTLLAILVNTLVTAVVFYAGHHIRRVLSPTILEAIGRFIGLLLGAYGVMMIREGLGIRRALL
jgi:multiple antibiotic resistance protein